MQKIAQQHVLLPLLGAVLLVIVWGATANIIHVERTGAERVAAGSTLELLETYEAQMLRNLREIDQTLKVVKFAYASSGPMALAELKDKGLLPPDLLFSITIRDGAGRVLASTRATGVPELGRSELERIARTEDLSISRAHPSGGSTLLFSRQVRARDSALTGVVSLAVDAGYFVSGYERSRLGDEGVLGLVGTDGAFMVRRSADTVFAGDGVAHAPLVLPASASPRVDLLRSPWDGVMRYLTVRPLYSFPLTLVVGLSRDEQLAATTEVRASYLWRAALGSLVVLLVIAALARVTWKLAQSANRETEARMAHAERVQHLAYHDNLTGLPNRVFFSKMLEQGIGHARRSEKSLAVLFIDLDRFKSINDTLGHQAGDRLLEKISERLRSSLRESDTIARLGGDEFVVLLPEFEEQAYVAAVAQKLLRVVAEPFELHEHRIITTASIGIAIYPRDGHDEQALMKCADGAMYHAKSEGKDNFQYYAQQLQADALARLSLEVSLREALERDEFELHYQPKVEVESERITGVEALLRWRSLEHGMVSPADFIPIAEYTGLIVPIGRWVLETACAQAVSWHEHGLSEVAISINLSPRQFSDPGLLDDIKSITHASGIEPALLELEITESMLMQNVERALRVLEQVRALGVRLAIDDFGTGYSSLSNLKRFPLNTLKIDRAFIRELPDDSDDRAITEAIIGMGKALGLTIVAEGVETRAQAEFLRDHLCDQYQGFHFSKPIPANDMTKLLQSQRRVGLAVESLSSTAMQPA